MKKLNLVLEDLRMVIANSVDHLGTPLEDHWMCGVANLEELMLLLHKDAIGNEEIATHEVQDVGGCLLFQAASQRKEEGTKENRGHLVGKQAPLDLLLKLPLVLIEDLIPCGHL